MNYLIKNGFLVVACSIGAGLSQSSVAANGMPTDTATASIDWSQLELSVTGVNDTVPTVVFSGQNTSLSSYASSPGLNESNSKSVNNWSATAETNADAGLRMPMQWLPRWTFQEARFRWKTVLQALREIER